MNEIGRQYKECQEMIGSHQIKQNNFSSLTLLRLNLTCGLEVKDGGPSFGGVFIKASPANIDQRFEALDTYIHAVEDLTGGFRVKSEKLKDEPLENGRMREGGFQIMVYNCSQAAVRNNSLNYRSSEEPAKAILDPFTGVCKGRTLFITNDGVMGLGPNTTRFEDKVCIIHGCRVPFIIRRIEEQKVWVSKGRVILKEFYVLIGECYVHGFMNGEALKDEIFKEKEIFLL